MAHAIAVRWAEQVNPELTHTVVARKAKGGEHHAVEASYKSVTTSVEQSLYLTDDDVAYMNGKKVLLVDDVYGGGGTTKALKSLVEQAGCNCFRSCSRCGRRRRQLSRRSGISVYPSRKSVITRDFTCTETKVRIHVNTEMISKKTYEKDIFIRLFYKQLYF